MTLDVLGRRYLCAFIPQVEFCSRRERADICGVPGSVERYLKVMDQLKTAIDFFQKNSIHSMEASTAVSVV